MDQQQLNIIVDYLYQYKVALLEKVVDKISDLGGIGENIQYSVGNFAVEDVMDNSAMRISHLNILIIELQSQLEEHEIQYEKLTTQVHTISAEKLQEEIPLYMSYIPPSDLKWVHLEKVKEGEYCLIISRREDH